MTNAASAGSFKRRISLTEVHFALRAERNGQLDPQSLVVQSVGVLMGRPLFIAGKLPGTFGSGFFIQVDERSAGQMDGVLTIAREGESESERGRIRYPIQVARWNLYAEDNDETNLYLEIETDLQIRESGRPAQDEWWEKNDRPSWSLTLIQYGLRTSSLAPGTVFSLPDGYDKSRGDFVTRILFDGVHQQTDKNTISILAVDEDRLLIRIEGQTIHGTCHEPVTTHTYAKLAAEAWFKRYEFQFCP